MTNPDVFAFELQKSNAKIRGIPWELEFWEWLQIWQDSGHYHERGKRKGEWCMARYGDKGPYSSSNVKIVRTETNTYEGNLPYRKKRNDGPF